MMRVGLLPLILLALLATAAPAAAAPLPLSGTLDLDDAPPTQTVRHSAEELGGVAGGAVAGVGDFDGDGKRDIAVGEPKRDTGAGVDSGAVYVVTDTTNTGSLTDAAHTITIRGAAGGDYAGFDVTAAGDVNGDGLQDILVGAPLAGPRPEGATVGGGEAYLVFGRPGRAEIDLASPDFGGIRITGGELYSWLGRAVSTVGDLNGDGRPELVVGAPLREVGDRQDAGSVYVIFGAAEPGTVDVSRLVEAEAGYRIDGAMGQTGRAVGSIGDLDGDGRPEVLVTAPLARTADNVANGVAYVVSGQAAPGVIDLVNLGTQGYTISRDVKSQPERAPGDFLGESITGLGDVNGDQRPDLIVGSHLQDGPNRKRGGLAYVVFGKADKAPVNVEDLGAQGYKILGVGRGDNTGFSTASAGDYNADGISDLVIGSPFADPLNRDNAGAAYVIFGTAEPDPPAVDLAEMAERGLRIAGQEGDATGFTVDGAGDLNGDGGADLVIGSPATSEDYLLDLRSIRAGSASITYGAAGAADIPAGDLKSDPGYEEAVKAGCTPAINVQAVLEDNAYTDDEADPQRIRMTGLQAYVATPRNFDTVLGVTGFQEGEGPTPVFEPTELGRKQVNALKKTLKKATDGEDVFPGYGKMFAALADDNPSATARIMLVDGFLFRNLKGLKGLTRGSEPTYIIAVGHPPDRNRTDINQMLRITRETKGRYYESRSPREIERALQAIQSRIRCDVDADNYQEELQAERPEEVAEVDVDDDAHSADVVLSWFDEDQDFEFEDIDVLDEDGDLVTRFDEDDLEEAYEADEGEARAAQNGLARITGGRGRTFRSIHIRQLSGDRRLRVRAKSDNRRSKGKVFVRISQSRNRR
ncbi:MAG TPA: hypothetical protein VF587_02900 [Solirubrobacteraceae bacterium]|jgi:hypothetical protein